MKYATAQAFRRALEERLRARSRRGGPSLIRLRKSVVFDRLLARLLAVAPDHWVLKGALALDYRFGDRTRTTKDIDLGREDDEQAATTDFIKAQSTDLDDHFVFVVEKTGRLDDLDDATAVRYHVACELAARPFDDINVDIAFGNPQIFAPEVVRGPELLDFADIQPVEVPAIPLPQHVAEKVHAYTRTYGREGRPSTRVKDLVDLVLIATEVSLDAVQLRRALEETFEFRATHALPDRFSRAPREWVAAYARMARELGLAESVDDGHRIAAAMLDPVLGKRAVNGKWDPQGVRWR